MRRKVLLATGAAIVGVLLALLVPVRMAPSSETRPRRQPLSSSRTTSAALTSPQALAPPRLVTAGRTIITDPADPSYDALALSRSNVFNNRQIFDREPRDLRWATKVEAMIYNIVVRDFQRYIPEATPGIVECHTSSCRIRIGLPRDDGAARRKALALLQFGSYGQRSNIEKEDGGVALYAVVGQAWRGPEEYLAMIRRSRAMVIDQARRSKGGHFFIPVDQLPTE
jgi:hypothetical protein